MKPFFLLGLAALFSLAATAEPARDSAPADGFGAGTSGGAAAISSQIYTVSNRAQLLAAIANGGSQPICVTTHHIANNTAVVTREIFMVGPSPGIRWPLVFFMGAGAAPLVVVDMSRAPPALSVWCRESVRPLLHACE